MRRSILRPVARTNVVRNLPTRRTFASPPTSEQAMPIGRYYEIILDNPQPIPLEKPEAPPPTAAEPEQREQQIRSPAPPAAQTPKPQPRGRKPKTPKSGGGTTKSSGSTTKAASATAPEDAQARARIIFGSRLAGPAERAERLAAIRKKTRHVAGVAVPPKPDEPDNCCMSGCVNCVWDRFRDEMEEWAAASQEAERRLAQRAGEASASSSPTTTPAASPSSPDRGPTSMDDDGGGSAGNWSVGDAPGRGANLAKDFWDDELYRNVPVGIREFMKQEKRLKEKHIQEGTAGG